MKTNSKLFNLKAGRFFSARALTLLLAAMGAVACAQQSGSIVAWGYNNAGQCNVPLPNTGFVAVAGGWNQSLGLKADGSIVAWGDNSYGQCNVPAPNTGFVSVAGGYRHSLGLKADGSIVVWGDNSQGQRNVPAPNTGFAAIAAGRNYCVGVRADGSIVVWGSNFYGQHTVPPPNTGFVNAAGGSGQVYGLKADGSIVAWGDNSDGQCNVTPPNTGFVSVAAGQYHGVGLKYDGSIVAWGNNLVGQCNVPLPNADFAAVGTAPGGIHSLGLKADGSIVVWGSNDFGQTIVPTPNTGFVALGGGYGHCLGIKSEQTIFADTTSLDRGFVVGGTPAALNTSNNVYYVLRPGITLAFGQNPIVLTASFTLPSASASALNSIIESRAQQGNTRQTIEVYDFTTNSYELLSEQVLPTLDTVVVSPLAPTANYVGPGNEARMRISYRAIGPMLTYPWRVYIDEATLRFAP